MKVTRAPPSHLSQCNVPAAFRRMRGWHCKKQAAGSMLMRAAARHRMIFVESVDRAQRGGGILGGSNDRQARLWRRAENTG